jgi:hypothetical protein
MWGINSAGMDLYKQLLLLFCLTGNPTSYFSTSIEHKYAQALAAWYSMADQYVHKHDSAFKHCLAIEEAALLLPELSQAETRWLDSEGEADTDANEVGWQS